MNNELVNEYYAEMKQSIKTGRLNFSKLLLADDAVLIGPGEKHEGKNVLEPVFNQFTSIIESFEIKRQIVNQSSACSIIEYQTKMSPQKVEMAEWIEIKNGRIVELRIYFDTAAWGKATQKR